MTTTRPKLLHLQLTERCNLACPGCYLPSRKGSGRTADLVENRVFRPAAESGVRFVTLTGGEPLLHPEHLEICALASRHFVQRLLVCNGTLLTLQKYIELRDHGVTSIKVSLDSLRPDVHDRLRGHPGCFAQVTANLASILNSQAFKSSAVDIGIITTVREENVDELESIALWARQQGINHVLFQPHHPYGPVYRGEDAPPPNAARLAGMRLKGRDFVEKVARQVAKLVAIKRDQIGLIDNSIEMLNGLTVYFSQPAGVPQICRADRYLFIDSDFRVRGCLFCGEIGSLLSQTPADIYGGAKWKAFQDFRRGCRLCLMGCQFRSHAETSADAGFEHYLAGELDEAESCFTESLSAEPSVQAEHGLGLVRKDKNDPVGASEHLQTVVRNDPVHLDALTHLVYLGSSLGDPHSVCRFASYLIRLGSRTAAVFHAYGRALQELGQLEAAAERLREAAALEPNNRSFHQDYGLVLKKLQRYDAAMNAFAQAVSVAPGEAFPHYALGVELARKGRDDEARHELEVSLNLEPSFAWCSFQLGRWHAGHRDWEKAERLFSQAADLEPDNPEFRKWRDTTAAQLIDPCSHRRT